MSADETENGLFIHMSMGGVSENFSIELFLC